MSWKEEIEGDSLTDIELRESVEVKFLEDSPSTQEGQFGKTNNFNVELEGKKRVLICGKRLSRKLAEFDTLLSKTFKITRTGTGFDIDYTVAEV